MSKHLCRVLPAVALFACLPLAAAVVEMSASAEGRGSIAIQGQSLPVTLAEVSLIPGGRFIVSLTGEDRYAFRGEWEDQGNRIFLTIKEAQGAAAEGTGELRLRGDRFRAIQIAGANRSFAADFTVTGAYKDFTSGATTSDVIQAPVAPQISAPRPQTPEGAISAPIAPKTPAPTAPSPSLRAPKVTVQGSGSFALSRSDNKKLDAMEVFLEPDGHVNLKGFGPDGETVLSGTWSDGGNNAGQQRFNLAIVPGAAAPTAGRGYVLVDNAGHIDEVSVQGGSRVFRTGYTLSFRQR